jgi:hypothetical protein
MASTWGPSSRSSDLAWSIELAQHVVPCVFWGVGYSSGKAGYQNQMIRQTLSQTTSALSTEQGDYPLAWPTFPRRSMSRDKRQEQDLHALNEDGMVLCNPRDKEAAHRAEMEGIATQDRAAVTCRKCLRLL